MTIIEKLENEIDRLVQKFGDWVRSQFTNAAHLYEKFTALEKQAAQYAYGVVGIINANIDKLQNDAGVVIAIIQEKFPKLSLDVLHGFLETGLNQVKAFVDETPVTLEDALKAAGNYLNSFKGEVWKQMSQAFGNVLSVLFAPGTAIQKFIQVAEIVYQLIVKPEVAI